MIDDRAFRPNTLDAIGKTEARFRSLGDTSADATTARERLLLTFLGGIAKFERDLMRARTGEGRARQGAGRSYGATPASKASPARGSLARPRQGQGDAGRHRAAVQCEQNYDFEAARMNAMELRRIDAARNMRRNYRLDIERDLLRQHSSLNGPTTQDLLERS